MSVGLERQTGIRFAGKRNQLRASALDQWHDRQQFCGLAGIGERDKDVVARDHAEVPVASLGRMHEICGGTSLDMVDATLRAMCPDLPMPLTVPVHDN